MEEILLQIKNTGCELAIFYSDERKAFLITARKEDCNGVSVINRRYILDFQLDAMRKSGVDREISDMIVEMYEGYTNVNDKRHRDGGKE